MVHTTTAQIFAPVIRVVPQHRELTVRATSERTDTFKTRFSYQASKDAFQRWLGNVREMHQSKAVGTGLRIIPHEVERAIDVVIHISKGAEDTWQKVLDGTLRGASIGASNVEWQQDADGVPVATRYDLVELSLVDHPANPDCQIFVIRGGQSMEPEHMQSNDAQVASIDQPVAADESPAAAGEAAAHDHQGEQAHTFPSLPYVTPPAPSQDIQRAVTADAPLHRVATSALHHALQVMADCGCAACQDAMRAMHHDPAAAPLIERSAPDHEQFRTVVSQNLDRMATILQDLTERVERIAIQPVAGGPVAMQARGFQSLPLQEQISLLQSAASRTNDPALQMEAAAAILQMQRSK